MNEREKIKIVILAGGKGKRMQSDLPKALSLVSGKPMIKHLLESIEKSGVCEIPSIVVGYGKELVMKELGEKYDYTHQEEPLGTGHAVMCTHKDLENKADHILVLYADNPFIKPETIKKLADKHLESKTKLTMATVKLPDFKDWRNFFYKNFSRIIRDKNGEIIKSVEFRDATEKEKNIKEVNPCYFCFDANWLWKKLRTLKNNNAQKEYYLTDLVKIAMKDGLKIESISINPQEALAANSKEELEILEKFAV